MTNLSDAVTLSKYNRETTVSASAIPSVAACSSHLKQEFLLHDWWLIKVNSGCHGKQLGIGGFTSRESQAIRCFFSAPIVKRCDAVTLMTADGITIMVNGHLNRSRTLENGFSCEVCDHFVIGFPYYWEEFAVNKEPEAAHSAASSRIPVSDARKEPDSSDSHLNQHRLSPAGRESSRQTNKASTPNEPLSDSVFMKGKQKRNNRNLEGISQYTGRLTRSKSRLLDE